MDWIDAGVWLLVGLTAAVTVLAAYLLWADGYTRGWRASRNQPPTCPKCGYNLSGQRLCRCPECGGEFRLDELWRSAVMRRHLEDDRTTTPTAGSPEKTVT